MTKRLLSIALILLLGLSLLSGCTEGWTPPPEDGGNGDITLSGSMYNGKAVCTVILHPDGTVECDANGEKSDGTWEAGSGDVAMVAHLTIKGEQVDMEIMETEDGYSAEHPMVPGMILTGAKGAATGTPEPPQQSDTSEQSDSPEQSDAPTYPENSLVLDFTSDTSDQLQKTFYVESDTWGPAFGGQGDYTPTDSADELFAWNAGKVDSSFRLTFFADGTYKFEFTDMSLEETGTWTWADWELTVTSAKGATFTCSAPAGGSEPSQQGGESSYPENSLVLDFTSDTSDQLQKTFYVESGTWGPAFGGQGDYTPTDSADELFAWNAGKVDSAFRLTFFADGTYKFEFTTMGVEETGTWTWADWKLTVTSAKGASFTGSVNK